MQTLVSEAINNAREAGETSIMIDYADDGTATVQGGIDYLSTIGYRLDSAGNVIYDAPGELHIHVE